MNACFDGGVFFEAAQKAASFFWKWRWARFAKESDVGGEWQRSGQRWRAGVQIGAEGAGIRTEVELADESFEASGEAAEFFAGGSGLTGS